MTLLRAQHKALRASQRGTRQGCCLGGMGFNATLDPPITEARKVSEEKGVGLVVRHAESGPLWVIPDPEHLRSLPTGALPGR